VLTDAPNVAAQQLLDGDQAMQNTGLQGRYHDLLPEALRLLRDKGLRLPPSLLPRVLNAKPDWLRELLLPVLGERGRWLAQLKPAWAWAAVAPDSLETLWQDDSPERRLAALRLHRRADPAGAREKLRPMFRAFKVDIRVKMVDALAIGLSPDDEPFLEEILDDRDGLVRRRAACLLARLPESAWARRLVQGADSMLARVPNGPLKGRLLAVPPKRDDEAWRREGIDPDPERYSGADKRGRWMVQTLQLVPVQHWVTRFGEPLEALLASLEDDWKAEVLEGWTLAATVGAVPQCLPFGEIDHMPALWDAWWERRHTPVPYKFLVAQMLSTLARQMRPADADPRLCRFLADPHMHPETTLGRVLGETPAPWTERLAESYLETLTQIAESLHHGKEPPRPWLSTLDHAARALPSSHIASALALTPPPETVPDPYDTWRQVLEVMQEKLALRQQLIATLDTT
jgi:hypothetical protein